MYRSKNKIKVLQLRSSIGFYGAENVILELCKQLKVNNIIPYIGVIQNSNPYSTKLATIANQHSLTNIIFSSKKRYSVNLILEISEFIKKNNIDIIHSHGYKANFYAYIIRSIKRIPCVATCHPWDETDYSLKARFYTFFDKKCLKKFDHLIPVSRNVEIELPNSIKKNKITLIPNGVDCDRFCNCSQNCLRKELNLDSATKIIGTVGRLVPEKGYIYLIKAIHNLVNYYSRIIVVIVGDGPLKNELIGMVRKYKLEKQIVFLGIRDDIPAIFDSIDIFVLSSISEGLPMVVLEAMAAGKPIVATSVGDIPTIIQHNQHGLLVHSKDSDLLYRNMRKLLENHSWAVQLGSQYIQKTITKPKLNAAK
jgi:glycosyltransferase involved in cell wall biosynthesis